MEEPIFYEIPIYRCTLNTHTIYMKDEEQKWMSFQNKELAPDSYQSAYDYFHHDVWYPWHYNEIIGYLNLYIFGSQFRIDIWFIKKQRIKKGIIKKKFFLLGKVFDNEIPRNKSSAEIFQFILEKLIHLNKQKRYKKYHFDLKSFEVIGQFVNWSELIVKLNSFSFPEHRRKYFEE